MALNREVLIYVADEEAVAFPYSAIDHDSGRVAQLLSFKKKLRERHTVDTFSTPEDLAAKLKRDFEKHFAPREPTRSNDLAEEFRERG